MNLSLALVLGGYLPPLTPLVDAAIVGFFGYGVSLVLFVLALRYLGAARTGAYFSAAPFIGATLALVIFKEPLTARLVAAGFLMAFGLYLHLTEQHSHIHAHGALDHSHNHLHDAHHQHIHAADDPPGEPHSHPHHHSPMEHSHPHYPDLHHRHDHDHGHRHA